MEQAPALQCNLNQLTAEINKSKARIAKEAYGIGIRLIRIRSEELWASSGYAGFVDYLRRAVDLSESTAYKCIRIATHFNAPIAERYGMDKLDAAISYMNATTEVEEPGDLLAAELRIRGEAGKFTNVGFHEAVAAQVREATALLKEAQKGGEQIPHQLQKRVAELTKALPPAPKGTGSGARVRLKRGRDGVLAVSFQAIPMDDLPGFVQALSAFLMD